MKKKLTCPICGTRHWGDTYSDECPECGWVTSGFESEDDPNIRFEPHFMSINKAKELYAKGKTIWGKNVPFEKTVNYECCKRIED